MHRISPTAIATSHFCQVFVNGSPDYQGHDHSCTSPDSWCRSRRVVTEARQRIKDALSMRHDDGGLHAIEYVASHTGFPSSRLTSQGTAVALYMAPSDNKGARKPLLDPSGTSKKTKSRLVGMLPAVARTVIANYDHFDGFLQRAVHLLPAEVFTHGSPPKAVLKRRVSSQEAVTHDLFGKTRKLKSLMTGSGRRRRKR